MPDYLHFIFIMLGILFIMFLIYLLISTCLDCDKYSDYTEDISYIENVVLFEHKLIDPIQQSQPLILGTDLCAQFLSLIHI